jgi:hypothetical protein
MTDCLATLKTLHRPKLLIRAARHGVESYNRNRDLKRVLRATSIPRPGTAVSQLMEREAELEETRKAGDTTYSVVRHLDALIALMAEARLIV